MLILDLYLLYITNQSLIFFSINHWFFSSWSNWKQTFNTNGRCWQRKINRNFFSSPINSVKISTIWLRKERLNYFERTGMVHLKKLCSRWARLIVFLMNSRLLRRLRELHLTWNKTKAKNAFKCVFPLISHVISIEIEFDVGNRSTVSFVEKCVFSFVSWGSIFFCSIQCLKSIWIKDILLERSMISQTNGKDLSHPMFLQANKFLFRCVTRLSGVIFRTCSLFDRHLSLYWTIILIKQTISLFDYVFFIW